MTTNAADSRLRPLSELQVRALASPLNPSRVSKRDGNSYLEAWDVKASLIKVFGFGGFSSELIQSEILDVREVPQRNNAQKMNQKVTAKAVVRLTIHQTGAVYTEAAIAGSQQPDLTESMDMAIKSAESDALKRAAIFLGTQFGLSLYQNGATHDVVQRVFAPGMVWPPPPPTRGDEEGQRDQQQPTIPPAPEQRADEVPMASNLTAAQQAANQALLDRALKMKAEQPERGAEASEYGNTPMVLDPTLQ